jgi:hypothetical protein
MKVYFVIDESGDQSPYFGELAEAKMVAEAAAETFNDVRLERCEVATDPDNILSMLNGDPCFTECETVLHLKKPEPHRD